jgi:Protein of unknown function (DUF1565)
MGYNLAMRKLLLALVLLLAPAIAHGQCTGVFPNGTVCGNNSGGPAPPSAIAGVVSTTSNLTFYVATTGSDSNAGASGAPFLTIQHALNVAATYNYVGLYYPTINIANGTYSAQNILPALVNSPNGGVIVGNTTTWANVVVNDQGTAPCFGAAPGAIWSISGMRVGGTYGAFAIYADSIIAINQIDFHGGGTALYMTPGASGILSAYNGTLTVSSTAMNYFIQSNGFISLNTTSLTFSNAITFANNFMWLDSPYGFLAGFNLSITNGANVTSTSPALQLSSGAVFEAFGVGAAGGTGTLVDGALMTRSNFPGHAAGFHIDAISKFAPDYITQYGINLTNNAVSLMDPGGTSHADYGITNGGQWTFSQNLKVQPQAGTPLIGVVGSAPFLFFNDTEASGHQWSFGAEVANGHSALYIEDLTTGGLPVTLSHNYDGLYSFQILSGAAWGWSSNATGADQSAMDTAFSRTAAATVALGNGTASNASGTLSLKVLNDAIVGNSGGHTISGLPSCSGSTEGMRSFVTNGQTRPTFLGTVSTTGSVVAPVFCNGTAWVYG